MGSNSTTFRNHYDRVKINCCPGNRMHTLYSGHYNENGSVELVESGKENIYDYIQSFKDSCDINILLRRFKNGEVDVLSRVQGSYGDFTEMPKTYADLLNRVNDGKSLFDSLPVDIRAKFGHNFAEFMSQIGTSDWFEKVGISGVEAEVRTSESKEEDKHES